MSKKVNPVAIGIFVVTAFLLFLGTGALLLKDTFFKKSVLFILYFDSSVNGLDVGSAVKFRGVHVGTVKSIEITHDTETGVIWTPMIIEINASVFSPTQDGEPVKVGKKHFYEQQIMSGLAAKLAMESFITGKLFVELDYYHPSKTRFYGKNHTELTQIPTVKSEIEKIVATADTLLKKLGEFDFQTISKHASSILKNVDRQLEKTDIKELVHNFSHAAGEVQRFLNSESLKGAVEHFTSTMAKIEALVDGVRGSLEGFWKRIDGTALEVQGAAKQFEQLCGDASALMGPDSDLYQEVKVFLVQGTQVLQMLRQLLELLNRSPNVLLTGINYEEQAK